MAELTKYKDNIEARIRPLTETSPNQMVQDMQLLVDKLVGDLQEGKERSLMYLNEMKGMVDQNTGNIQNRMDNYLRRLKKRLHADTVEIRKWVARMSSALPNYCVIPREL